MARAYGIGYKPDELSYSLLRNSQSWNASHGGFNEIQKTLSQDCVPIMQLRSGNSSNTSYGVSGDRAYSWCCLGQAKKHTTERYAFNSMGALDYEGSSISGGQRITGFNHLLFPALPMLSLLFISTYLFTTVIIETFSRQQGERPSPGGRPGSC